MIKELKEVKRDIKVIRNYCEEKQCVDCKIKRYCSSSWHIKGKNCFSITPCEWEDINEKRFWA